MSKNIHKSKLTPRLLVAGYATGTKKHLTALKSIEVRFPIGNFTGTMHRKF